MRRVRLLGSLVLTSHTQFGGLFRSDKAQAKSDLSDRIAGAILVCLGAGIAGCANPGIPRPPSLRLPATVLDLTGTRVGDRVELRWTGPGFTTDGLDLTGTTTVEICRYPAQALPAVFVDVSPAVPCSPILSVVGHSGASSAVTRLPANLIAAGSQQSLVGYRIRVLNSAGRSSAPSPPVLIPGGPAPPTVAGFRAEQQQPGVVLSWDQEGAKTPSIGGLTTVEVQRTLQEAPSFVDAANTPKSSGPDPFARARHDRNAISIRFQQAPGGALLSTNRHNGMVDQSALQQETYIYTAQRVQTVSVAGKILEIRSEPTIPIKISIQDIFPPVPPEGLVSVPGIIGSEISKTGPHRTIDLAWEPNTQSDLAGYLVYRADPEAGKRTTAKPIRLTPQPLPGSAFRDTAVIPGHRYLYYVTAVDRNGKESLPSASVEDVIADH